MIYFSCKNRSAPAPGVLVFVSSVHSSLGCLFRGVGAFRLRSRFEYIHTTIFDGGTTIFLFFRYG